MTGLAVVRRSDGVAVLPAVELLPLSRPDRAGGAGPGSGSRSWDDGSTAVAVCGADGSLAVADDLVVAVAGRVPAAGADEEHEDAATRVSRRWRDLGPSCLRGLPDDVVVAVLEVASGRLSVFRDVGGAVPAYLWAAGAGAEAAVTTSLPSLVGCVRSLTPDETWVSAYLGVRWTPRGHTAYAEVMALEPGSLAHLGADGWVQRPHDAVEVVEDTPASLGEAAVEFRRLLDAAVRRRVADVGGPVAVTLSGGLDSSSVLVTARAVAPEAELLALCLGFSDAPGDERAHQVEAAEAAGARLVWVGTDYCPGPFGTDLDTTFAQQGGPPLAGNWFLHEGLVAAAVDAGAVRVLDGEDADSLLGAGGEYLADWAANEGLRGLLSELRATRHRYGSSWPALAHSATRELVRAVGPNWGRASSLEARGMLEEGFLGGLMGETSGQWEPVPGGISHPFLDRALMAFALGLPGQHRVRGTVTKVVLRAALPDRLPPGVLARTDKARLSSPMRAALTGPQRGLLQDGLSAARRDAPDIRSVPVVGRGPVGADRLYRAYRVAVVAHWRAWLTHRRSLPREGLGFSRSD